MVQRNDFNLGTLVEDRNGTRGVVTREPWDGFAGVMVEIRWYQSLSMDTVEGSTSVERIDNLSIVRR